MKTMKYLSFLTCAIGLVLSVQSCNSEKSKSSSEEPAAAVKTSNLDENYVTELYSHYVNSPVQQAHIDENIIIDHILEGEEEYVRTPSGLYYYVLKQGNGNNYVHGQDCSTDYKGYFLDQRVFDSSYSRGEPIHFKIGQMNPAWNEALKLVNPGTHFKLIAPSRLAYGARGFPGYVPPNTVIAFEVVTLP